MVPISNLFIPGFAKCGTSSLHEMLKEHSQIQEGKSKESHLYTIDKKYSRRFSKTYPHAFANFYEGAATKSLYRLDSSTSYSVYPEAINRIKKDCPEAKFIILVRDPFERIKSHYRWMVSLGFVEHPFELEIKNDLRNDYHPLVNYWGNFKNYVYFSKYGKHLKYLYSVFPAEQVLVLKYETLITNTQQVVERICQFLKISIMIASLPNSNRTQKIVKPKPRSTSLQIRYELGRLYRSYYKGEPVSPLVKKPLAEVPKIEAYQLDFLFEELREDLDLFQSLGFNLDHWQETQRIIGQASVK